MAILDQDNPFSRKHLTECICEAVWREMVRTAVAEVYGADQAAAGQATWMTPHLISSEWHWLRSSSLCLAGSNEPAKAGPGSLTPGLPTVLLSAKQIPGLCHSPILTIDEAAPESEN